MTKFMQLMTILEAISSRLDGGGYVMMEFAQGEVYAAMYTPEGKFIEFSPKLHGPGLGPDGAGYMSDDLDYIIDQAQNYLQINPFPTNEEVSA